MMQNLIINESDNHMEALRNVTETLWSQAELIDNDQSIRINDIVSADISHPYLDERNMDLSAGAIKEEGSVRIVPGFSTLLCNRSEFMPSSDSHENRKEHLKTIMKHVLCTTVDDVEDISVDEEQAEEFESESVRLNNNYVFTTIDNLDDYRSSNSSSSSSSYNNNQQNHSDYKENKDDEDDSNANEHANNIMKSNNEIVCINTKETLSLPLCANSSTAVAAGLPIDNNFSFRSVPITIARTSADPINEFINNDILFSGTFPSLFLFGLKTFSGSLPRAFVKHLLKQYTNKFAQSRKFLFTATNQLQRHIAIGSTNLQAKSKPSEMKEIGRLAKSKVFRDLVDEAIKNTSGPACTQVLSIMRNLISVTGSKVPYSPSERASGITTMYAYSQFFGLPSVFFTFSQDAVHNLLVIRLSHCSISNHSFPAENSHPFSDCLKEGDDSFEEPLFVEGENIGVRSIPCSSNDLHALANLNPTAEAEVFGYLIDAVYKALLGIDQTQSLKKSTPMSSRPKGIFSKVSAAYNANEPQARGLLHLHMIIWGSLNPEIMQACAAFDDFVGIITKVLDSMFCSSLPLITHISALTRLITPPAERLSFNPLHTIYNTCPNPVIRALEYKMHCNNCAKRVASHQHNQTCHKGIVGKYCCRLCYPRECIPLTTPVELESDPENKEGYRVKAVVGKFPAPDNFRNYHETPFEKIDKRCIIWEGSRPRFDNISPQLVLQVIRENQYVIERKHFTDNFISLDDMEFDEFKKLSIALKNLDDDDQLMVLSVLQVRNSINVEISEIGTGLLACNTAAYSLGGIEQTKSTMFYVIQYVVKNPISVSNSLAVIKHGLDKIEKYGSTAEDSGTELRSGMHLMQVISKK